MMNAAPSTFALAASFALCLLPFTAEAQDLHFNIADPFQDWSTFNPSWSPSGSEELEVWSQGAKAIFSNPSSHYINMVEDITASAIDISGELAALVIFTSTSSQLTLTGTGTILSNTGGETVEFSNALRIHLANVGEHKVHVGENSVIRISDAISGNTTFTKTGSGDLRLLGDSEYMGVTVLQEGVIEVGHSNALGTSSLRFQGGTLRFANDDYSAAYLESIEAVALNHFAKFDTNSFDISLKAGLTGEGGLEKTGLGMLTLTTGNTYSGPTLVRQGVLRAAEGPGSPASGVTATYPPNPFGTHSSITIMDGGTLDINGNSSATTPYNTKRYRIYASGLGASGWATIWNSGKGLTNTSLFEQINFETAISFGANGRFDISNTVLNGGTNTFMKRGSGELAFSAIEGSTVGDIDIESGMFTIQSSNLGSTSHRFIVRSGGTLNFWVNSSYSINKKIEAYNTAIIRSSGSNPSATNDNVNTGSWAGDVNLVEGRISLENNSGYRNSVYLGAFSGAGQLQFKGNTHSSLLNPGTSRTSTHFFLNPNNSNLGDVTILDSIVRLSNETLAAGNGGKLGSQTLSLFFNTAQSDGRSVLDLHGTDQTIAGLHNLGTGESRIQNRRSGTTSTLSVGYGSATSTYTGILEDQSSTFKGNSISSDGTTGKLALQKIGTGILTLTKVNTFTGGLSVLGGTLEIGNTTATTSTAQAGNVGFQIHSEGKVIGNGRLGHAAQTSMVQSGGTLSVGTTNQGYSQKLTVLGALNHLGTLEIDLWNANSGSGNASFSDTLVFEHNSLIQLQGTLKVTDKTGNSTQWTEGTWFQVLDWTHVTTTSNRDVAFQSFILPTLAGNLFWDTSSLQLEGLIRIAAIPEPSRGALLLGAGLILGLRRRR